MAQLNLFKNLPFDGEQVLPSFGGTTQQNAYFDNYADKLTLNVAFNKMGEPLLLSGTYDDLTEYGYGRIKVNNKWYYLIIDSAKVIESSKTELHYRIDSWTTYFYANNLFIKTAHLSRRKKSSRGIGVQPAKIDKWFCSNIWGMSWGNPTLLVSYIKNNKSEYTGISIDYAENLSGIALSLDVNPKDITGVWICPIDFNITQPMISQSKMPTIARTLPFTLESDGLTKYVFVDGVGNIIYTCEPRKAYGYVRMTLLMTMTTAKVEVELSDTSTFSQYDKSAINNGRFFIMCEPLDTVIDVYQQYAGTQRQADIDARRVQSQHAMVKGMTNTGMAGLSGGIQGAVMGNPLAGAGIGAVMNVATVGVNYALETKVLNNEIQGVTDTQYRLTQDELGTVGVSAYRYLRLMDPYVYSPIVNYPDIKLAKFVADNESIRNFHQDIETNGVYVDEIVPQSLMEFEGAMKGDIVLMGNAPMLNKQAIRDKLNYGVYFVRC